MIAFNKNSARFAGPLETEMNNNHGMIKSARAARIDSMCSGLVARPDYSANVRAAQQAVAAQLRVQP
jgi:hypothetical protein